MKSFFAKIFAAWIVRKIRRESKNGAALQEAVLHHLVSRAKDTAFGIDHRFDQINSYDDYCRFVPVRDYEDFKDYVERMKSGEPDILWPGQPIYLAKTSGTTSGAKYIPISAESISNHIHSARNALLCYIAETGKAEFVNGKMIFLQGSPEMTKENGIYIGRLSGIVAHHVPAYLQKNRMPSFETNCIDDWETKVSAITEETIPADMRLISGIPPWLIMYFESLKQVTGKQTVSDIFPNFSLLVFGGVNFKPYRKKIRELIGRDIDSIELYPASEGFIAYQDLQDEEGMLLNVNSGLFFEFIPASGVFTENPTRIMLRQVELDVNYALIISNNAGLWSYNLGDTIKFVSLNPYRIIVTGRIKHFTSAFGEHVIAEEVESAMNEAVATIDMEVNEFHVAPVVNPEEGELPFHQWLVEFSRPPADENQLADFLDHYLQKRNPYYKDLRAGNILQRLKINALSQGAFSRYMKSIGKLGGQNKIPRLANDRNLATEILRLENPG